MRSRKGSFYLRFGAGNGPDRRTGIVDVFAPVSGVITGQQITNQSGVKPGDQVVANALVFQNTVEQ